MPVLSPLRSWLVLSSLLMVLSAFATASESRSAGVVTTLHSLSVKHREVEQQTTAPNASYEVYQAVDSEVQITSLALTEPFILWTERGFVSTRLLRRPRLGGRAEALQARPVGPIGTDATHVYWVERGRVWRMPLVGGIPESVYRGNGRLVLGEDHVYVLTNQGVLRAPKQGGEAIELGDKLRNYRDGFATAAATVLFHVDVTWKAGDRAHPYGFIEAIEPRRVRLLIRDIPDPGHAIQVVGDHVYYLADAGRLYRAHAELDATPRALFEPSWKLSRFVVDGDAVYALGHAPERGIYEMKLKSGLARKLGSYDGAMPRNLVVDATHVYWDTGTRILRTPRGPSH